MRVWTLLLTLLGLSVAQDEHHHFATDAGSRTRCYDSAGRPQRCIPPFENAAFNVLVETTNTCGEERPTEFCIQTGTTVTRKNCDVCYAGSHPAHYLTDFNNNENQTWWQSETMFEGIQYPYQVNLTLHLRKAFDITYVRLWFYSPRPESFAIYKRTTQDGPWIPYQFYSATCRDTYGLPDSSYTRKGPGEAQALCTAEYSDISPLTGGNVAFSTLEGRPSAYSFDNSPELQEWVTATDIRIVLGRLNTFGDEVFGDEKVLKSYFYAISDFAVGARCKCNGHASECVTSTGLDGTSVRVCRCEHNTAGPDCDECLPFYNDAPWGRATADDARECKACNCNGFSNRCFFDKQLYDRTGHGGHCLDCLGNRDGPNCERCKENFYHQNEDDFCIPCNCNEIGSRSLQCNREGRCQCKPGVTGDKCDRCDVNHYEFGPLGCKHCNCNPAGSYSNQPNCDQVTGTCHCKENVEGKQCNNCKPGFFNLDLENEFGCTPCFCYGHSSDCDSAPGYSRVSIESMFARGPEKWSAQLYNGQPLPLQYNGLTQSISVSAPGREAIYFVAPDRFLGDQRPSYNRDLSFKLRIGEVGPGATVEDVVLEGAGLSITQAIFGQRNPLPSVQTQDYKFRLHENPQYGWQPRLSPKDFISVLSNLTAIHIRGTYTPEGIGFLDDFKLDTARRGAAGLPARWVETCKCLEGYVGQYCESCSPGFRHEPANGGPFAPCVPCNCNGHADICDAETGRCICQHNTAGDNCERCVRGYYGNALQGSPYDCKQCPCPNHGPCIQLHDEVVVCLECPKGFGGPRCDLCSDGYYGDPSGQFGPYRTCQPCECNDNVDPNAVGNCNRTTGECLKCVYNTGGPHCDQCIPGYYGDALAIPKGDCKPCQCYYPGTLETGFGPPVCDRITGQCQCKPHIRGRNCDQCEDGYYNINSGEGCQPCNCDPIGSLNHTCDIVTGQCQCRPGVIGQHCDVCEPYMYGFSTEGCKSCDCDLIGSVDLQCDPSGQCPCLDNVEGRQCNRCKENKYDRQRGCIDCPACYNLVQDAANEQRKKLQYLEKLLSDIASNPTVVSDEDFDLKLTEVQQLIDSLLEKAKQASLDDDTSAWDKMADLKKRVEAVQNMIENIDNGTRTAARHAEEGENYVLEAEDTIENALEALKGALEHLHTDGHAALQKAIEKSDQFGQQSDQMSEIAKQARLRASELEKEAEDIRLTAEKALNISNDAVSLAKKAIDQQNIISNDLQDLKGEVQTATNQLELTKQLVDDTQQRAESAHENALEIYRVVSEVRIPEIDAPKLKEDAEEVMKEATAIKDRVQDLVSDHEQLLNDIEEKLQTSENLLHLGIEQQQIADELLADVNAADGRAEEAVKLANDTLSEAKQTLVILQGFDKQIQDSKGEAMNALEMVPDILKLIRDAENKTANAHEALAGAQDFAQRAQALAEQAQQTFAEQASKEAEEIRKEAERTKQNAVKLRDEADGLAGRVLVTTSKIVQYEEQGKNDGKAISTAKSKVSEAQTSTALAKAKVSVSLQVVEDIMKELENLPDIDASRLDELERRLSEAEAIFENSDLGTEITRLQLFKSEQKNLARDYQDELRRLEEEVRNIERIYLALPDGCFKGEHLEP